ncbi:hypothetical protein SFUMM280S_10078 [Streptomyces fumanus]
MLLPAKAELARELLLYRARERMMLASPADRSVRAAFEDSGTAVRAMGKRCAREAADAAERYLRPPLVTHAREQDDRSRPPARHGGARRRRTGSRRNGPSRTGRPRTGMSRTGRPRTGRPRTGRPPAGMPRTGPPRRGGRPLPRGSTPSAGSGPGPGTAEVRGR